MAWADLLQASSTALTGSSCETAAWVSDSLMTTASLLPWTTALTLKASPVICPASGCSLAKRAAAVSTSCVAD